MNMPTQKIALVTGASRGLGKDMAIALAHKGIDVVLTYRTQQAEAQQVVQQIQALGRKATALPFDLEDFSGLDTFVASFLQALETQLGSTTFDYLINNAGIGATIPFAQVTEADFDRFNNIHYKGVYFLTQKLLPHMNDHGAVINISSGTTRFVVPGYSLYSSLKGAIEVFTRSLAKEVGARGIRVNTVAPGPIETDFNSAAIRNNPQMKGFLSTQTALGRVGNADDIGGIVAFLCTDDARWINGQRIEVSGGINL